MKKPKFANGDAVAMGGETKYAVVESRFNEFTNEYSYWMEYIKDSGETNGSCCWVSESSISIPVDPISRIHLAIAQRKYHIAKHKKEIANLESGVLHLQATLNILIEDI